jgi:hypothetical protein
VTGDEQLGSVAEEAAKLFEALQGWATESGGADGAAAAAAGFGARLKDIDEHLATGGQDCTWCPICRAVALVRETSPEVRTHLASAASSLLQAAAGVLDAHAQRASRPTGGVQKIDLDDLDDEQPPEAGGAMSPDSPWDAD